MEFKHTLEVLHAQAEEITRIAEKLQSEKELRQIEIDLLLEKLRNIYDLASDLQHTIKPVETPSQQEAPAKVTQVKDQQEDKLVEPDFEIESEKEETVEAPVKAPKKDTKQESDRVSDRFTSSQRILNEEMSERTKAEDVTSHYKSSPISSITAAIGINERFELINELFEGDKEKFDKTIEVINMADSFVEAYNYLEEQFNWDMDNTYVQRILELIRRKLIVRRNEQ